MFSPLQWSPMHWNISFWRFLWSSVIGQNGFRGKTIFFPGDSVTSLTILRTASPTACMVKRIGRKRYARYGRNTRTHLPGCTTRRKGRFSADKFGRRTGAAQYRCVTVVMFVIKMMTTIETSRTSVLKRF